MQTWQGSPAELLVIVGGAIQFVWRFQAGPASFSRYKAFKHCMVTEFRDMLFWLRGPVRYVEAVRS